MNVRGSGQGLTLHSSWWGITSGMVSSSVLVALGGWGVLSVGFNWIPTVLLAVGVLLLAVVVFDLPVASRVTLEGIERRALARRHHLRWDGIRALSRGRPAMRLRNRQLDPGPLVAVVGRRRYMVIDQTESLEEYQQLIALLTHLERHDDIELLLAPPERRPPTWTYRRSRWRSQ